MTTICQKEPGTSNPLGHFSVAVLLPQRQLCKEPQFYNGARLKKTSFSTSCFYFNHEPSQYNLLTHIVDNKLVLVDIVLKTERMKLLVR